MKMKQKLAATLAGVMAVSMVPATSVFASSENSVSRKYNMSVSYTGNQYIRGESELILKTTGTVKNGDTLILTSSHEWHDVANGTMAKFTNVSEGVLSGSSLEKLNKDLKKLNEELKVLNDADEIKAKEAEIKAKEAEIDKFKEDNKFYLNLPDAAKWVYLTHKDTKKVVQVKYVGSGNLTNETLRIPVQAKIGAGSTGDITITVDGNGTVVDNGTYTVATVYGENITANLGSAAIKEGKDSAPLGKVTLEETIAGMFKTGDQQWITIRLNDADTQFRVYDDKDTKLTTISGGATIEGLYGAIGKLKDDDGNATSKYTTDVKVSADGMSLYIPVRFAQATTSKGKIYITFNGVNIYKNDDVDYVGEVTADLLDGYVENGSKNTSYKALGIVSTTKTALKDVEQAVNVTVAKPTELVAGRLVKENDIIQAKIYEGSKYTNYGNNEHLTAKVSVRESIVGAIDGELKFEFPEGVKVLGIRASKVDRVTSISANGTELVKLGTDNGKYAYVPMLDKNYVNIVDRYAQDFKALKDSDWNDLYTYEADGETKYVVYNVADEKYYEADKNGNITGSEIDVKGLDIKFSKEVGISSIYDLRNGNETFSKGIDKITVEVDEDRTNTNNVNLDIEFFLSVSADYEDDKIDVTVTTNVDETGEKVEEVVTVATVKKPVEVKAESKVIDESLKKQELGDVTITENFAGALLANKKVYIDIENLGEDELEMLEDEGAVTVESGDVKVSKLKFVKDAAGEVQRVYFTVTGTSTKASTIKVSGLKVNTRKLAGGYYELKVYGDAIAANDIMNVAGVVDLTDAKRAKEAKQSTTMFDAGALIVADYVTVGRELLTDNKAPEANNKVETQTVTLKKGDLTYTKADGTKGTMVAAPYFNYDANGGGITMVPIRAIGEILGAEVEWSQATQTATFTMSDGRFAQITLGSAVARTVDGSTLTMNWPAEVPAGVDGGIYAPIRYMARVLGFADGTVDYDYTNQCVVIQAPVVK